MMATEHTHANMYYDEYSVLLHYIEYESRQYGVCLPFDVILLCIKMTGFDSYEWSINDPQSLNKIVRAQWKDQWESGAFELAKLNWNIQLYPRGDSSEIRSKEYCGVFLELLGISSSWKYVLCQLHIECPSIESKIIALHPYKKPVSCGYYISIFEVLRDCVQLYKQLTFIITIRIMRIVLKDDSKILFQMETHKYKRNTRCVWRIDKPTMQKLKSYEIQKGIYSDIYNDVWCLNLYPRGCWNSDNDVRIGLILYALPPNVFKLRVQWTVYCHEANITQTFTNDFDADDFPYWSWYRGTICFAEFTKYSTWTMSVDINVLKELDANGQQI